VINPFTVPSRLGTLLRVVVALAAGTLVLVMGLDLAGFNSMHALAAMWRGAFGSWYALSSATLVRAVPLILIGLGIAFAFQAGAFNIGAEGQFYAGAIAATWIGLHATNWPPVLAMTLPLLAAIIAGSLWIAVPIWLRHRFGVLEVISTLLLNFVAEALVSLMVQGPLQESRGIYPQSDPVALPARLPFVPGTRLHWGIVLALFLAGILALVRSRTLAGFRFRAVGANPRAATVSGRLKVGRWIGYALLVSGAMAGLAGGMEVSGVTYALFQNLSPGYGFTGIAVALLARLDPIGIVGTGILFAALETGAAAMQREAGVPSVAVYVVEAVIIIVVLVSDSLGRRSRALAESPA
jgi:general nucleoside transport system permease protein